MATKPRREYHFLARQVSKYALTPSVPQQHHGQRRLPGTPSQVKLKLVFLASVTGTFPYHCHLLFHEDAGMMGAIRVVP